MQNDIHSLGSVLKAARNSKDLTQEQLAQRLGITQRYLTAIENEGKTPRYPLLFRYIRELGISADTIFYPERESIDAEREQLVHMLYLCGNREIRAVTALLDTLLKNDK